MQFCQLFKYWASTERIREPSIAWHQFKRQRWRSRISTKSIH